MIRKPLLAFVLACSLLTISLAWEQGSDTKPPLLTFADLRNGDHGRQPFRIEGYVTQIYKCPPCPAGAICKPCLGDHIVASDNLNEEDVTPINRLRIFTDKPDQFELKRKYTFTVEVRGKAPQGHGINEVELLHFDQASQAAPAELTAANWRQHPQIKAVRSIVETINAESGRGAYKTTERKFAYCESYEDTLRKLTVDGKGIARRYETQGGSDDSSITTEHYYDSRGNLRFVYITGGAVNGSVLEHRIYFDEAGKRIWEEHKYVKGPGYSFPEVWPDERIQKADPAKAFAATSPCPAERSKPRRRTD